MNLLPKTRSARHAHLLLLLLLSLLITDCSLFGYQRRWKVMPEYAELAAQVEIRDDPPYENNGSVMPVVGDHPSTIPRLTTT